MTTRSVNERELILEILLEITRDGAYSHIALRNTLTKYQYLEKKERAFITRVVTGTLERMVEIDYIIHQFSKVKVNKMKPVIRSIVRSGVYQLKYMDNVPASAVCNEAVKLAAKKGFVNLKGFVNGLLRNIDRNLKSVIYPGKENLLDYLSITYSMPTWIVEKWLHEFDADTVETMLAAFLEERGTSIRCNVSAISKEALMEELKEEGVTVKEHPYLSYALEISDYDYLADLTAFQKGHFYVQDVSSMLVTEIADPKQGDTVIDVCAAPGGKALHMAEKLAGTGHVEARDLTDYKVGLIRENIERSGLTNIEAVRKDATIYEKESVGKADIVVADLPCSGLGVLAKKVDLKYKMTKEMQEDLVQLQRKILDTVADYVKPGGVLVYSTCTINRSENEENVEWFLETKKEFQKEQTRQLLPGVHQSDGFFIAKFRKDT